MQHMASPLAIVCALALPQTPPAAPEAAPLILVSGCRNLDGSLSPRVFELGDGGVEAKPLPRPPGRVAPGEMFTPGGIRVRARAEGVKLDFIGGAELLITPSARLCLRGGEQTLPALGRLALVFADGSRLEVEPETDPRRPLARASLLVGPTRTVLWPLGHNLVLEAGQRREPFADAHLVLGDGRAVYRVVRMGPLLGLRAVLRPRDDPRFPASRFVIAGDVLADSLRRLPPTVPRNPVQFPQAPEAAEKLAELAPSLFPGKTIERAARARGPLVLALVDGWRLHVEVGAASGQLSFGLFRGDAVVPAVEWLVTRPRTVLQMVRPSGGEGGGPRYFLRGIDLAADVNALWPGQPSLQDLRWAQQQLLELGGRPLRDQTVLEANAPGRIDFAPGLTGSELRR